MKHTYKMLCALSLAIFMTAGSAIAQFQVEEHVIDRVEFGTYSLMEDGPVFIDSLSYYETPSPLRAVSFGSSLDQVLQFTVPEGGFVLSHVMHYFFTAGEIYDYEISVLVGEEENPFDNAVVAEFEVEVETGAGSVSIITFELESPVQMAEGSTFYIVTSTDSNARVVFTKPADAAGPAPAGTNWLTADRENFIDFGGVELSSGEVLTGAAFIIRAYATSEPTSTPSNDIPEGYALSQNFPNPFNPTTNIEFAVPTSQQVTLEVFNVLGHKVATLVDGVVSGGSHQVTFDASALSSGLYIYRLTAGDVMMTNKMSLIK